MDCGLKGKKNGARAFLPVSFFNDVPRPCAPPELPLTPDVISARPDSRKTPVLPTRIYTPDEKKSLSNQRLTHILPSSTLPDITSRGATNKHCSLKKLKIS